MPTGSSAWPAAGLAVAVPPASEVLKYQSYTVPIVHLGLKSQSQHSRSLWLRTAVPVPPAEPWIEPQSQSGTGTVCVLGRSALMQSMADMDDERTTGAVA